MDRETRNHILWIAALWVVFTALGEWLVQGAIENWPPITSSQGQVTGEAIFFLMRATVPIFIIVVLIVVYSAIRFRVPQDDDKPAEAQFASNGLFVGVWVGLSVLLNITFIIYPGVYGLESLWSMARAATSQNPLVVNVTAKQWEWDFSYPKQKIDTTDKLVVPVGRPIHFVLTSEDVMHSFWAPAWGLKKAVIPGETRDLVVTPTKVLDTSTAPTMRIQCAQICGAGHPLMRSDLRVVSAADFKSWVAKRQKSEKAEKSGSMKGMNMGKDSGTMNMGKDKGDSSGGMNMGNGSGGMDMGGGNMSGGSGNMQMNMDRSGGSNGMKMPDDTGNGSGNGAGN